MEHYKEILYGKRTPMDKVKPALCPYCWEGTIIQLPHSGLYACKVCRRLVMIE